VRDEEMCLSVGKGNRGEGVRKRATGCRSLDDQCRQGDWPVIDRPVIDSTFLSKFRMYFLLYVRLAKVYN